MTKVSPGVTVPNNGAGPSGVLLPLTSHANHDENTRLCVETYSINLKYV
jgi:hypothetical protein